METNLRLGLLLVSLGAVIGIGSRIGNVVEIVS